MSELPEDDRCPFEAMSRQEQEEYEAWVTEYDIKTVDERDRRATILYYQASSQMKNLMEPLK